MKRVLIYSCSDETLVWDASDIIARERAILALFEHLDSQRKFDHMSHVIDWQIHQMAKRGNSRHAHAMLVLASIPFLERDVIDTGAGRTIIPVSVPGATDDDNVPPPEAT